MTDTTDHTFDFLGRCTRCGKSRITLVDDVSLPCVPFDGKPQTTNLDARIDRVIRACLQDEPLDERIMFNFRTLAEFRAFIKKVLVTGNVQNA